MIRIAILTEIIWAFGTLHRGLQKGIGKNYKIDIFDWLVRYDTNHFIDYDIVIIPTFCSREIGKFYKTKNPILFTCHGVAELLNIDLKTLKHINITYDDVNEFKLKDDIYNFLKNETSFSVVSKELYNKLSSEPYNLNNVRYTPCGVDTSLFKPIIKNNSECLKIIHLRRNIQDRDHGYDVKRIWMTEAIEKQIRVNGYDENQIKFIHPNDFIKCGEDMRDFYNQGDVWLCLSHSEGNPLGPFEAAACGLTVISTNVGEMPEFIENGVNGFLVETKDEKEIIEQFVNHIIDLYINNGKLNKMKKNLHDKVIKTRDWSLVSKYWERWFDFILKNEGVYDFIEIGTSDFDTLIQSCDEEAKGLSIEPIKHYLDNLPNKQNVKKINCAVSDKNGEVNVYSIHPENIIKYNLPHWVRGCNSIGDYHPTVLKELNNRNLDKDIFDINTIKTINIATLVKENNIKRCKYLKIDTEGHDCIILNNYLDYCKNNNDLYPDHIEFESNILSDQKEVDNIIKRCELVGYILKIRDENTVLIRS